MDANTLITAISTVGFPIAACCVMFVQNNKLQMRKGLNALLNP